MTNQEIWKAIDGYEGLYEVSNHGNVRSIKRGIILKPATNTFGYQIVGLSKNGKRKEGKIHRLVAKAFIDNPNNKKQVNHIDGDKKNNNVSNLEWVTNQENTIHALNTGIKKTIIIRVVETGRIYRGCGECARAINGNPADIMRCLRTTKTKTHKGYHFEEIVI